MKKRLKFECWKCKMVYSLQREINENQTLTVACPFCNAEAVVDLNPYRSSVMNAMKGDEPDNAESAAEELQLPDVLSTQQPE